jgi:hypothetical protein
MRATKVGAMMDSNVQSVEENEGGNWWENEKKWLTTKEVDVRFALLCFALTFGSGMSRVTFSGKVQVK